MADAPPAGGDRGGFRGGFGRGRGRGRGGPRGRGRGRGKDDGKGAWVPVTKLGRLVKEGYIKSLEEIYLFSLPIKEAQIVDHFLGGGERQGPDAKGLKDEVIKIMPVQKQTRAGQRTRFKAFVMVGDANGHIGLGVKCASEVATSIRGAITAAKLNVIPIRRGWWGTRFGSPHTIPMKVSGKCGSVTVRLVPAPRGTGVVAAPALKKFLHFAGVDDVYTGAIGKTRTVGNFVKAGYNALLHTYKYLTPDLWEAGQFSMSPYQEFTDFLRDNKASKPVKSFE